MARKQQKTKVRPAPAVRGVVAYKVPRSNLPIDLFLDGNEGAPPPRSLLREARVLFPGVFRRYPSARAREAQLAGTLGLDPAQVLVTGGGDDALMRACFAVLGGGREMILPVPTFEMLRRFASLAGGALRTVPWDGGVWPVGRVLDAVTRNTGAIVVVSPNNPTGATVSMDAIRAVSAAAPRALVIVDLAYAEFAWKDQTPAVLALPNAIAVRSCSKAWGMAGLRVGYAAGPAAVIGWMRAVGSPYAVSGPSLAMAAAWLDRGRARVDRFVARVRWERTFLGRALCALGARPYPSEANFVLAQFGDPRGVWERLARQGIAVRIFPAKARGHYAAVPLDRCLRITCPGNARDFKRLIGALQEAVG